jgi:hypothetical protein
MPTGFGNNKGQICYITVNNYRRRGYSGSGGYYVLQILAIQVDPPSWMDSKQSQHQAVKASKLTHM